MVSSMTGYGNQTFQLAGTTVTVEIKSVNSRYLDIIPKVPRSLQEVEHKLKHIMQTYFYRGRVELYITLNGEPLQHQKVFINWQLLDEYMGRIEEVREKYEITEQLSLSTLMQQDALFVIQEEKQTNASFYDMLYTSVKQVCEQVIATRKQEGTYLKKDLQDRITSLHQHIMFIEDNKAAVHQLYQKRIEERIVKHLDQSVDIDQHQLMQDVAILADKGDIQEEITRLNSHLQHFQTVMEQPGEIGRKLDFIVQEMHREANTIGAKSIDARISQTIVKVKSDIEKMKEQIQNIE